MPALIVVADLGESGVSHADPWLRVRAGELPGLFTALRPALRLRTPDLLTGTNREVSWTLTPRALRDLAPESLLAAFPPAAELLRWRQRLLATVQSGTGVAGLLDAVERLWPEVPLSAPSVPAPTTPSTGPVDDIDALLGLVEGSAAGPPAATAGGWDLRERVLSLLGGSSISMGVKLRQARAATDVALGRQLESILHDPSFRDVEIAWRQLWALAEVADLRRGDLRLYVVPCSRTSAAQSMAALRQFVDEARDEVPDVSRIVVDHPVGSDDWSGPILGEAAALAASLAGTAFVPLDPMLLALGATHAKAEPRPTSQWLVAGEAKSVVAAIRATRADRLVVTCNRFLGRPPLSPEDGATIPEGYRESLDSASGPYANAVWIAARSVAAAARRGAAAAFAEFAGEVGGIPTRPLGSATEPGACRAGRVLPDPGRCATDPRGRPRTAYRSHGPGRRDPSRSGLERNRRWRAENPTRRIDRHRRARPSCDVHGRAALEGR